VTDLSTEILSSLDHLLRSPASPQNLPADLESELLLKGVIVTLQQLGSPEAVSILHRAGIGCTIEPVRSLALIALDDLASEKNQPALEALFELAIEENLTAAQDLILRQHYQSPDRTRQAVFQLLVGQTDLFQDADPSFRLLTDFYISNAGPDLRQKIDIAAEKAGLSHWILIVHTAVSISPDTSSFLLAHYSGFAPAERNLCLRIFQKLAEHGEPVAQEIICQLFVQYEEPEAREIAVHAGYAPGNNVKRALFYFLSEQWEQYETFDFDHRLLIAGYETADNALRKRLLDLSRLSGQMEWFQNLSGTNRIRWLRDLSDADWENTIQQLSSSNRWDELWRLSQLSSPFWSAYIFQVLEKDGWRPSSHEEANQFVYLAQMAREAAALPLAIRPQRTFTVPSMDDLTSMALSPDGKWLALGTSSNAIFVWQISDVPSPRPTLHGAVAQTRTLSFSADGEYLATSVGDNSIRIYRWEDGKSVKTLEGHQGLIRSMVISPDSRTLYSASFDGTVRSWRFPYGPEIKIITRSEGEFFGLALSPDGDTMVAAGAGRDLQVFQLPEGNKIRQMEGHTATVTILAAAPTTQFVASCGRDRTIRVWNYTSGRQIQSIDYQLDVVTGLCIHPNEHVLISAGYKGQIHLWSLSTGKPLYDLNHHRRAVIGLALSPDGNSLISASADGLVTIWNLEIFLLTRQPIETMRPDQIIFIEQLLEHPSLSQPEKKWLEFTAELLHWKQRFDVEIENPRTISVGEFDIQL
jgi:WD40 repeat protein